MEFRNAVFCRSDKSAINMEINHPEFGWIPFTATADDVEEHGQKLFEQAKASAGAYVPPTASDVREAMPSLSARQLRLGLINAGIMPSQVQTTIGAMPVGTAREKALVEWEFASSFERTHPLIASVGAALGLSEVQIDAMWVAAATL